MRGIIVEELPNGVMLVQNPEQGEWSQDQAWTVRELARFGGVDAADPAYAFGSIAALTLDEYGRLYILDRHAKQIRVFDQDGSHVRTLGREGRGPGELENPIGLDWDNRGRLWIVDAGNARYTVFDTTGVVVATHRRAITGWGLPWRGGFGEDGFLYEPSYETDPSQGESKGFVQHQVGDPLVAVDSLPLPFYEGHFYRVDLEDDYRILPVPFAPRLTWQFDGDKGIWFGLTNSYRLVHRRLEGDTLRIVERAFEPDPVSQAEKSEAFEQLIERFNLAPGSLRSIDKSRVPPFEPVFQGMLIDDLHHLWVLRERPGDRGQSNARNADIFDPQGRFLGTLGIEAALFPPPLVSGNRIFAIVPDALEVPQVVIYELDRG